MGFPAQLDQADQHFPDDDSVSHFAAKELLIILRVAVVLAIIATAVTMATFWFFAWVPLVVLLACIVALLIVNGVELRTRKEHYEQIAREHKQRAVRILHPDADSHVEAQFLAKDEEHFTPIKLLIKEGIIGFEILGLLIVAAAALVGLGFIFGIVHWEIILLGIGLFVMYGLLIMAPVWLGWFTDVDSQARGKASNEHISRT